MKVARIDSKRRRAGVAAACVLFAIVAAGCSSSPSSPPSSAKTVDNPTTAPSTTSGASATTSSTIPPKVYFTVSGKGDRSIPARTLPAKWSVTWHFDCEKPIRKATFVLTSTASGKAPVRVISQDGLGGGGQAPYKAGGRYAFGITTTCNWTLTLEKTPVS